MKDRKGHWERLLNGGPAREIKQLMNRGNKMGVSF